MSCPTCGSNELGHTACGYWVADEYRTVVPGSLTPEEFRGLQTMRPHRVVGCGCLKCICPKQVETINTLCAVCSIGLHPGPKA